MKEVLPDLNAIAEEIAKRDQAHHTFMDLFDVSPAVAHLFTHTFHPERSETKLREIHTFDRLSAGYSTSLSAGFSRNGGVHLEIEIFIL